MNKAVILIGSNDNKVMMINKLCEAVKQCCQVLATSSVYESKAVGQYAGVSPHYLNQAFLIAHNRTAQELKEKLLRPLEIQFGVPKVKKIYVKADIDIVLTDDMNGV